MNTLPELARRNQTWSLEEFVSVINEMLPQFLPTSKGNMKVREEINLRLVRHYTSLGLVDEPQKSGKYALYTYRHLLQILVVRRLLAEGISANAINQLVTQKSNTELENLLMGGLKLNLTTANPALSYLEQLRQRSNSVVKESGISKSITPSAESEEEITHWIRLSILPGLEIHLRSDFNYPNTISEQHSLSQKFMEKLKEFAKNRKSKS